MRPLSRLPLAFTLLLLVSACGNGETTDTVTARPAAGGTLTYATDREPTCLDPHVAGDMPQTYVAQQVLDSLVAPDPKGRPRPWLATSWDISNHGRTYTFHLRRDVRFTDGTRFDAVALFTRTDSTYTRVGEASGVRRLRRS